MIKNELKEKLGEDWRSKFSHRDCDQSNYEFGEFEIDGKKINLVLNPKTEDIMEYYYDDFSDKISINSFIKSLGQEEQDSRKYYIDRDYNYYSIGKSEGKSRVKSLFDYNVSFREDYSSANFMSQTKKVTFSIHRLIAFMFIPNPKPESYSIVNHKDGNTYNFKKENLEWCDYNWNNASENRKRSLKYTYRIVGTTTEYTFWGLKDAGHGPNKVVNAIKENKKYHGVFWERLDKTLLDYLSRHPIVEDEWYDDNNLHNFGKHKVRANSCGVLDIDGRYTVGTFDDKKKCYTVIIDRKHYYVSRLLFEIINNKIIAKGNVIDHIIPISENDTNNSIINLREVSQKENMNNPLTKEKLSTSILAYDIFGNSLGKINSYTDAGKLSNTDDAWVKISVCNNNVFPICNNYFFRPIDSKEEDNLIWLKDKMSYIYYRLSIKDGISTIECGNKYISRVLSDDILKIHSLDVSREIIKQYLNTGVPAPDGYYYQQGDPKNMIYDQNNYNLDKKREIKYWHK